MPRQRGSSNVHNTRNRPRERFFSIAKSAAKALTNPPPTASSLATPNSFSRVDRHQTETPPLDDLFLDWLDRPRSVRATTATPQFAGLGCDTAMKDMVGMTTEAEFEDLPIAVQRKYFSTLERLRIAQGSETASTWTEAASYRSAAERRQTYKPITDSHYTAPSTSSRRLRRKSKPRPKSISLEDISWFQTLPDKIQKKQFSKQEQHHYRRHNTRKSVVLDAADEAIFKQSRRNRTYTSSINAQPLERALLASTDPGMQLCKRERPTSIALAMAEQFRWMDEENDLDKKLQLDNYHANLTDVVIPSPEASIRPSFRRNMSISKMPFSRPNVPAPIRTASGGPTLASSQSTPISRGHSRAMSLMSPRFSPEADQPRHSIDPLATHYKNPDARLKLRVYLASPQKFDEAIEFGFPSEQGVLEASDKENHTPKRRQDSKSGMSEAGKTFFNDDVGSLLEDDNTSIAEPDSPVTPSEDIFKPQHSRLPSMSDASTTPRNEFAWRKPNLHKHAESYSLSSTGAREMTLRMTLTRPDLRADEGTIYGWQAEKRGKTPPKSETPEPLEQAPMRGPFDGEDGWGPLPKDDGRVKRFWNRVKPQRKAPYA